MKYERKPTIAFVHGLWLHPSSWSSWQKHFSNLGYETVSLKWPGDSDTVEESRANPDRVANVGVRQIADYCAEQIATLHQPVVVIGHSYGGLVAQELLGRGIVAGAVAIDPAPIKGIWRLPASVYRSFLPILLRPFNHKRAVSLSYRQFRYGFANRTSPEEARQLYDSLTIPSPAKPLFEVAIAPLLHHPANEVTTAIGTLPLLITAGERDHNAPPTIGKQAVRQYPTNAKVDFVQFKNRGHSLIIDSGWYEVADHITTWIHDAVE